MPSTPVRIPCLPHASKRVEVGGVASSMLKALYSYPDIDEAYDDAVALLRAHDVPILRQRIGDGTYASVFPLKGRTDVCIKLTLDPSEAAAVQTLLDAEQERGAGIWNDLPALARVYCVVLLKLPRHPDIALYAITMDRMPKAAPKPVQAALDHEPIEGGDTQGQLALEYYCRRSRVPLQGTSCEYGTQEDYRAVKQALGPQMDRIEQTWRTLVELGIEWPDLHGGNVMQDKEGNLRIIDLGRAWTKPQRVGEYVGERLRESLKTHPGGELWYHLTDDAKFDLDPAYAPEDNAVAFEYRGGRPGIYLSQDVERWVNGHGYWRPFVVEFLVDPSVKTDRGVHGRWGGEMFVPAASFGKLTIQRVIPLDAYGREQFGGYGWIEVETGFAFDTGEAIEKTYADRVRRRFQRYSYSGPDVREMSASNTRWLADQLQLVHPAPDLAEGLTAAASLRYVIRR